MLIRDHKIVGAEFCPTPNCGGTITPDMLVWHYTATPNGLATVRAMQSATLKASAHLCIDRDGKIWQLVPFNVRAWHAGKSSWKGRSGLNDVSIGIEIVNPGPVVYDKVQARWEDVYGRPWTGGVVEAKMAGCVYGNWATYTEAQLAVVEEVSRTLVEQLHLTDIAGHSEIAPGRKIDPGPAFPLDSLRAKILDSREADGPDLWQALDVLNRRSGPGVEYAVSAPPLAKGDMVTVTSSSPNGWKLTRATDGVEAWVNGRFLRDV